MCKGEFPAFEFGQSFISGVFSLDNGSMGNELGICYEERRVNLFLLYICVMRVAGLQMMYFCVRHR